MKILFIHKNYPAQFGRVAHWLAEQGWDVAFATTRAEAKSDVLRIIPFAENRAPSRSTHHYLIGTERAVLDGQGFARAAVALEKQGYYPDVVVAHSGWGVGFFVKDVWPQTKFVQYAEWYYNFPHADKTPHATFKNEIEERAKARIRNAPFWIDFSAADATICPTDYQAAQFPLKVQEQITVINDGFDTKLHVSAPRDAAFLQDHSIPQNAELLTYIARGMEPTRGFPEVMKTIEKLQQKRPNLHAVIIAEDRVAYGAKIKGLSWKERMTSTLDLDPSRLHFTGLVPRHHMIKFLQASDAHLYLSAPFVLSWSFVEAMACATPIVATRSAPVAEYMDDGHSGLMVDMYNIEEVARAVDRLLDDPTYAAQIGAHARSEIVTKYDANSVIFPRQAQFFSGLLSGEDAAAQATARRYGPKYA